MSWILSYTNRTHASLVYFLANKKDTPDKRIHEVLRRMDALMGILLETGGKNGTPVPMVTRIRILSQTGMRPIEISKILGKKPSYVTKELARLRKEGMK
jgi:DNA-binding MarR family transcriptional regulator